MERGMLPALDFAWATERWRDELTGTEVVRLSGDESVHYRNPYFRVPMFTADGQYAVLAAYDGEPGDMAAGGITLCSIDLRTGRTRRYPLPDMKPGLSAWAVGYRSHKLHAIVRGRDGCEIEQIDLDTGSARRVVPCPPMEVIHDAAVSADDRHAYTQRFRAKPDGMGSTEYVAMMGAEPGPNEILRIDLDTGEVETLLAGERVWLGHPNPNPARDDLFMYCQEGFIWTDRYPRPPDFQRVRLLDVTRREAVQFAGLEWAGTHESWSADGRRIYGHNWWQGHHCITVTDPAKRTVNVHAVEGHGHSSIHVRPAPDESFVVGDGLNFGGNNRHEAPADAQSGDGDNPWSWDGIDNESPGEVIWRYELPARSAIMNLAALSDGAALEAALAADPEGLAKATPICRFRGMVKLLRQPVRVESNAHVTPDSRWVVFQSAGQDGRYEVWAACTAPTT